MLKRLRGEAAGSWIVAAALVVLVVSFAIIFLVSSNVYEAVYHDHATSERQARAQQEFEEHCARLPTVEDAAACFKERIASYGEAQRAQEDLYAQKQMAKWAWWMLLITGFVGVLTVAATALGVFFVARTLRATERALDTANKANSIMSQEQRPWVKFSVEVTGRGAWQNELLFVPIRIEAENIGKTPAFNLRLTPENFAAHEWEEGIDYHEWFRRTVKYETGFYARKDAFNRSLLPTEKTYWEGRFNFDDTYYSGKNRAAFLAGHRVNLKMIVMINYRSADIGTVHACSKDFAFGDEVSRGCAIGMEDIHCYEGYNSHFT